jgi:hypothetical protein
MTTRTITPHQAGVALIIAGLAAIAIFVIVSDALDRNYVAAGFVGAGVLRWRRLRRNRGQS